MRYPYTRGLALPAPGGFRLLALLLLCAYVIAFAQRQLVAVLSVPIAAQFAVTDMALGALHGSSFGVVYAMLALPAGCLVDRLPRGRLLAAGLMLSAIGTALSSCASSFEGLMASRALVAIGQSTLVPAAYALLGDVGRRDQLGLAVAGFAVGPFLGAGGAALGSAILTGAEEWQTPFQMLAVMSAALALLIFILPGPHARRASGATPPLLPHLRAHARVILPIMGAMLMTAIAGHLLLGWAMVWLMRGHGLSLSQASLLFGAALLLGGVPGTLAGGAWGDHLVRRGQPRLIGLAVAAALAAGAAVATFLVPAVAWSLACLLLLTFLLAAAHVIGPGALQEITSAALRGRQHGLAVLVINLIALGVAPLLSGAASDVAEGGVGTMLAVAVPGALVLSMLSALVGARAQRWANQAIAPARPASTTKEASETQPLDGSARSSTARISASSRSAVTSIST